MTGPGVAMWEGGDCHPGASRDMSRSGYCVFMTSSLSSDGTLKTNGVRFGSSEIYSIGTQFLFLPSHCRVLWEGKVS